jgi:hypothetical protein
MRKWVGLGLLSGLLVAGGTASAAASPSVEGAAEGVVVETPVIAERSSPYSGIRDEAAMVLVGTFLIGLAGAVRRAA